MVRVQHESHLVYLGRTLLVVSLLFLLAAIFMSVTGGLGLKMNPRHLFNDAIVFSLFGIGLHFIGMKKNRRTTKRHFGVREAL